MGKKAKLKEIRRLAKEIPTIPSSAFVKVVKNGAELLKEGVTQVGGKAVNPMQNYSESKRVLDQSQP